MEPQACLPQDGKKYRFSDCTDGLSNTFLVGEGMPSRRIHMMYFHSPLSYGKYEFAAELLAS